MLTSISTVVWCSAELTTWKRNKSMSLSKEVKIFGRTDIYHVFIISNDVMMMENCVLQSDDRKNFTPKSGAKWCCLSEIMLLQLACCYYIRVNSVSFFVNFYRFWLIYYWSSLLCAKKKWVCWLEYKMCKQLVNFLFLN